MIVFFLGYQTKYNWEVFDTREEINFTLIFEILLPLIFIIIIILSELSAL